MDESSGLVHSVASAWLLSLRSIEAMSGSGTARMPCPPRMPLNAKLISRPLSR